MLERQQATREQLLALRPEVSPDNELAIEIWNAMGGQLVWSAVPILFGLFRVTDPLGMLDRLQRLRIELERPEATPPGAAA